MLRQSKVRTVYVLGSLLLVTCIVGIIIFPQYHATHARGVPSADAHAATTPIQHIVFIIKENHSFDNYFGSFPGVNGEKLPLAQDPVVRKNSIRALI